MKLITLTLDEIFSKPRPVQAVDVLLKIAVKWDDYSVRLDDESEHYARFKKAEEGYRATPVDLAFFEWLLKTTKKARSLILSRFGGRVPERVQPGRMMLPPEYLNPNKLPPCPRDPKTGEIDRTKIGKFVRLIRLPIEELRKQVGPPGFVDQLRAYAVERGHTYLTFDIDSPKYRAALSMQETHYDNLQRQARAKGQNLGSPMGRQPNPMLAFHSTSQLGAGGFGGAGFGGSGSNAAGGTFMPGSGSVIRTQFVYDGNSRTVAVIDDNGGTTSYSYDAQNRQTRMQFADGSSRNNVYNACGSLTQCQDENGNTFNYTYDSLGRQIGCTITPVDPETDPIIQMFEYDGLSRLTKSTQTQGGVTVSDETVYDSLSRPLESKQSRTIGAETVTRFVTNTAFTSLVLSEQTYPSGNSFSWEHDLLYRKVRGNDSSPTPSPSPSPSGTVYDTVTWSYAGPSRVVEMVTGNGIACTMLNNERTGSTVQTAVAGSGNVQRPNPMWGTASSDRLGYDGSGRMIAKRFLKAELNENGGYADTTPIVGFTTSYDKAGNKYYERLLHAENRSHLYQAWPWNYNTQPGSATGYMSGAVTGLGPALYDANASGIDSANRLRQYERGTLAGPIYGYLPTGALPGTPGAGGHAIQIPIDLPGTDTFRDYTLDGLGNWESTGFTDSGETEIQVEKRSHNLLNQITQLKPSGETQWTNFSYDKNGNLLDDGVRLMAYDLLNRLVEVKRKSDEAVIAAYTYDVTGRCVLKTVSNGGLTGDIPDSTTELTYFPGTWQVCEERRLAGETWAPSKQYVWGLYIDELVRLRLMDSAAAPYGPQELPAGDYYPHQDLLYRTAAMTDSIGNIVEAYDYDAYGNTLIFTAPGAEGDWWATDALQTSFGVSNVLFCGYVLNCEADIYRVRERYYEPKLARWISVDPLPEIEGLDQYQFHDSAPVQYLDPQGTHVIDSAAARTLCKQGEYAIFYNTEKYPEIEEHSCVKEMLKGHEEVHIEDWKKKYPNGCIQWGRKPRTKKIMKDGKEVVVVTNAIKDGDPPYVASDKERAEFLAKSEVNAWTATKEQANVWLNKNAKDRDCNKCCPEDTSKDGEFCCNWMKAAIIRAEEVINKNGKI